MSLFNALSLFTLHGSFAVPFWKNPRLSNRIRNWKSWIGLDVISAPRFWEYTALSWRVVSKSGIVITNVAAVLLQTVLTTLSQLQFLRAMCFAWLHYGCHVGATPNHTIIGFPIYFSSFSSHPAFICTLPTFTLISVSGHSFSLFFSYIHSFYTILYHAFPIRSLGNSLCLATNSLFSTDSLRKSMWELCNKQIMLGRLRYFYKLLWCSPRHRSDGWSIFHFIELWNITCWPDLVLV